MSSRLRSLALVAAGVTLAGGGTFVAVTVAASGRPVAPEARQSAAERFLQLSGDATTQLAAADAPKDNNGKDAVDCTASPATRGQMPNGWCIGPAGTNVDTLRFPLGVLPIQGGSKIVVTSDSGGVQGLSVIDPTSMSATPTSQANLFMGLAEAPSGVVYASGGNADRVFRFRLAGSALVSQDATEQATFPLHNAINGLEDRKPAGSPDEPTTTDGIKVPGYPGPMATYGNYIFVAGTLSEPSNGQDPSDRCPSGQSACGRVSVIDTTTDTVVRRIPVGLDAIGLAVDSTRKRLYVANWADEAGRANMRGGTVSTVDIAGDPSTWHETSYVVVGHHPSAVQLSADDRRLFVANTNDDTLSVIDLTEDKPEVEQTESVAPANDVPVGAHPDALALSPDGSTLFVALAGMNAVEVRDGRTGQRVAGAPVYIPTGWYPSALTVTGNAQHYRLWIANAKGLGPGPGYNGSVFFNGTQLDGSVNAVDLPVTAQQQNSWTQQTVANDHLRAADADPCRPYGDVRVSQVLCPPHGQSSPIKHVLYIVTENKTFDQYFGDMGSGYSADPSYVLYGRQNTPNHHAIADRYSLGDNFFSDAEVSVTGHSWTSGAVATDHNEKTWEADYDQGVRGTHGNGDPLRASVSGTSGGLISAAEDELNDPEGGYIFEAFKRAGAVPPSQAGSDKLSMAIYGEHIARESGHALDAYVAPGWKDGDIEYYDTCRAKEFITGKAPDDLVPYDTRAGQSAPLGVATYGCEGRTLPAQFTLAQWEKDLADGKGDTMPSFMYMSLPDNHTMATNVGSPTPQSMVADNDYAIGLIVDALSHSPFWKNTAVVQTEDDTQIAGDHVSSLRDYLSVASPWAQPGADHQWGSMPALLRTIEQIFGVQPVSLFDRLAMPMHDAFLPSLSDQPDLAPYDVQQELVPFALNSTDAPYAALSSHLACLQTHTYDLCNEQLLNKILWAAVKLHPVRLRR